MELLFVCILILATGACIGSFLNVVALRALTNESIVFPSSKCPKCGTPIKWYDNIPVFSYLFTFKGKCRNCKESVSKQYPIVEALTSILFLIITIAYGFTIKTLLILILLCISVVIIITDIKKEYVFERHAWILIAISIITSLYINGIENYTIPAIGLIAGVIVMELLAKSSYYLIRKNESSKENETIAEESQTSDIENENFDINEYIKKNKRAFGEGDTYLAGGMGALLGFKYLLIAIFMAIVIQAVCLLPQFIKNLYAQKHYRLLCSLSAFILTAFIYWTISNITQLNLYITIAFIVTLLFFAIDTIKRLKQTTNEKGFSAIPFGPALLISSFLVFFFGAKINEFLLNHIFI